MLVAREGQGEPRAVDDDGPERNKPAFTTYKNLSHRIGALNPRPTLVQRVDEDVS